MEEALRHVQNLSAREPCARQGLPEVGEAGLVGADLLGGDDLVKGNPELARRAREEVVIDVLENDEPVLLL